MRRKHYQRSVLESVLPSELIEEAVQAGATGHERERKLPLSSVGRTLVGMGLFRDRSARRVLSDALAGLGGPVSWGSADVPHHTSLTEAIDRLGFESTRGIFRAQAHLLTSRYDWQSTWHGHLVTMLDGSCLRTADNTANDRAFGRPGVSRGGKSAFPMMRLLTHVAAGTHLLRDVVMGPYCRNELKLAEHLLDRFQAGSILLMDRAFHCYSWLGELTLRGVHFVVRAKAEGPSVANARKRERLGPRDHLGVLPIPKSTRLAHPHLPEEIPVRVISAGHRGNKITVLTSLLDAARYPAREVLNLHAVRWEAELAFRELKPQLGHDLVPLRMKTPTRVLQEAYGLLTAYNCVRGLMCEAAEARGCRPLRLSFTQALQHVRSAVIAATQAPLRSEREGWEAHKALLLAIGTSVLQPKRVGRSCPRAVKVKSSNFPRKRPGCSAVRTRRQDQRRRVEEARAARERQASHGVALAS